MKKIICILLVLTTLAASAQVDSTKQNIRLNGIQARDWEYCFQLLQGEFFDPLTDSLKARVRANPGAYTNTTQINIDSVERREILSLHYMLRMEYTGSFSYTRVDAAIRALNDPYINSQLAIIDNNLQAVISDRRTTARKRILGQRN